MTESNAKQAVKKSQPKKASSGKATASPKPCATTKKVKPSVDDKVRYEMIQYAAYFIAERNGFVGDPQAFWAEAEALINASNG